MNDPVKHCPVYKEIGCSHVDGYLCDFPDCSIMKDYQMNEFTDYSNVIKAAIRVAADDYIKTYQFVEPLKPNVKLSFGEDTTAYFLYHAENVPNRFQRWMLLKVFGVKLEKI